MGSTSLRHSLQETLELFNNTGAPQTTSEIAEQLDIGRRSTYNRLNQLSEDGWIKTKKVGGNGRIWWRPFDGTLPDMPDWNGATASLIDVLDGADVGVFVLDENYDVVWLNQAAEMYFDLDPKQVLGRDKRSIVEEQLASRIENAETFTETVLSTYEDGTNANRIECQLSVADDSEDRWLEYHGKPIETGAFAGGRVELYDDITPRKRSEQSNRDTSRKFQQLIDTVEEYAIFTLDTAGQVQSWNPGAREIKGYESDEILGEHCSTFYTVEDREAGLPEQNLSTAATVGTIEVEGWRVRKDGSRFWANVTIKPLHDEDGDLEGYAKITRDMTDRREYEQMLTQQTERLERQRDELQTELDEIFERIDDAFYALDDEFQFDYVNKTAAAHFGHPQAELLGRTIWDVLDVDRDDEIIQQFETAMAQQEPVSFERYSEELGLWETVEVYPSETGLSVYFRDITDRKTRDRKLEQYEKTIETIWDGVATLDDEGRFVMVNEAFCEMTGYSRDELLGERATLVHDKSILDEADELTEEMRAADKEFATLTFDLERADGETTPVEARFGPYEFGCGKIGQTGVIRDISARVEYKRELEESEQRYRTLVENFPDGSVGLFDEDLCYTTFGGELMDRLGVDPEQRAGRRISEVHSEDVVSKLEPKFRQALDGESNRFEMEYRDYCLLVKTLPVEDADGEVFAGMVVVEDITDRKKYEQKLEASRQRYRTVVENFPNGAVALIDDSLRYITFGGDPVEEAQKPIDELEKNYLRDILSSEFVDFLTPHYRAALQGEATDAVHEVAGRTYQFHFIPVRDQDGNVTAAMGMSQDMTQQKERQREIEQQRQQLAALNNLHDTVRDITDAIISQPTREEIESIVCERLAEADSYEFAWIGDVDVSSQTVNLRTEAGVEGYLDDVGITVDPDDKRSLGPTGRALRTGEIQTTQDVTTDDRHDPWRDHIQQYSVRSSVAIPLVHEGTVYGVLNVYADRPDAFEGRELEVLGQLGEVVGHAIASTERKRALMSDDVTEFTFRIQNFLEFLDIDRPPAGKITIDHAVPIQNDEFLLYGTATPDAVENADAIVEAVPHWIEVSYREIDQQVAFELRVTDPPVLSKVAALGGSIESAVIEDGDYQMTVHVTPSTDVRQIIDAVETYYPPAEMVKRHRTKRTEMKTGKKQNEIVASLTDRQRTCLETAVYSGYFEWPRDASAEDIADSIGIAPPTFHQHLRKAEKKVFNALYPSPITNPD